MGLTQQRVGEIRSGSLSHGNFYGTLSLSFYCRSISHYPFGFSITSVLAFCHDPLCYLVIKLALNVDESVWFDRFFYPVICPTFYVETLADLKKPKLRRSAEEEVGIIADKFPEMQSQPTPYYQAMAISSLMGQKIPMTGQIPLASGRPVKSGKHKEVVYEPSPEVEAFRRWQLREFDAIEREFASDWRQKIQSLNLNSVADGFRDIWT